MDTRRSLLTALGTGTVALVSGCLDLARGKDVQYESSPAAVTPSVVAKEGFEAEQTREPTVERTIDAPVGGKRTVTVKNWAVQYAKSFSLSELGTAALQNNDLDPETIQENVSSDTLEEAGVDPDQLENGSVDETLDSIDDETLREAGIDPSAVDSGDIDAETLEQYGIDPSELKSSETDSKAGQDGSNQSSHETQQDGDKSNSATGSQDEQKKGVLFAVVSTPQAKVLGQGVNPAANLSNEELVEKIGKRFAKDKLEDLSLVTEGSVTLLGSSQTLSTFETRATIEGLELDVRVHLTKTKHENDLVIAAGAHPRVIEQQSSIESLINNVEHPAELPSTDEE
jgi:hypothetical protein